MVGREGLPATRGDGTPDTRRIISRTEIETDSDPAVLHRVVETLTEARLLTVDDTSVQIAHEALLRTWPRLRSWIEDFVERIAAELGRCFPTAEPGACQAVAAGLVGIFFTVDSLNPLGSMRGFRSDARAADHRLVASLES